MGNKPVVFSGIQPTGGFHIGNYIGALNNWNQMQDDYACIYSVVDLHSLTVRTEPARLTATIREAAAMLLALGIDPKRSVLFAQSEVRQHAELCWILCCYTQFGELSRMTQFKDKSSANSENINAGLFAYPVLMAADILLYDASFVPIGEDQRQHLEICRDIAGRFNGIYGAVFTVPEGFYPKIGARVMSLQDPVAKMSKSDPNDNSKVMLTDSDDIIIRKFKRAVTDSGSEIRRGEGKEGVSNLIAIYSAMTGKSPDAVEAQFSGRGYGDFKLAVGEAVVSVVAPLRNEYERILLDRAYLDGVLKDGAGRASEIAERTFKRVKEKMGLDIYGKKN
ncbi:MAG: tryptophan--tRNA ligase [Oscillospiraceae bacterium]|nr:tryptophan--tRNA ligase [Oscillospiraceae bacterium]